MQWCVLNVTFNFLLRFCNFRKMPLPCGTDRNHDVGRENYLLILIMFSFDIIILNDIIILDKFIHANDTNLLVEENIWKI